MEKKLLNSVFVICVAIASIAFYANSSGPGIDASGSPFDSGGNACTQCHSGTLNSGSGSISYSGPSSYYPGSTYSITVTVSQSTPTPGRYGFQGVMLTSTNSQAGDFTPGTGTKEITIGGRKYIEHNSVVNTTGSWTFDWEAPNSSSNVTFYVGGMAANGNGGNSGDLVYTNTFSISALTPMTFNEDSTNVSCAGSCDGSASVSSISGGTAPYTYQWSNSSTTSSITGLCAGVYTVTITDDDGNTETADFNITSPPVITSSKTVTAATCGGSDGAIALTTTGGTPGYGYLWNTGATSATLSSIASGTYTVTVTDANGCTEVDTTFVPVGASGLSATFNVTNDNCGAANGILEVVMQTGQSPYSYSWSNGATTAANSGLVAGTYTVTVVDANGCTDNFSETVGDDGAPVITVFSTSDLFCNGDNSGSIEIKVTGGAMPYSYAWSTGGSMGTVASGLPAGEHTVTVTDDNGCSSTASATLNEPDELTADSIEVVDATASAPSSGAISITVAGGTPPYLYDWSDPNNQTTAQAFDLEPGTYSVTVEDANGCTEVFSDIMVDLIGGVSDFASNTVSLFPNPASELIRIESRSIVVEYSIMDLKGTQVQNSANASSTSSFNVEISHLQPGYYFIKLRMIDGNEIMKDFVVK